MRYPASTNTYGVIYDPGVKMEKVGTPKPSVKHRNQFRIAVRALSGLYARFGAAEF